MNLSESQFQNILWHSQFTYWNSIEIKNGLQIRDKQLFPLAMEYAPKEDLINDWFGNFGRGIDQLYLDEYGTLYLVEMKKKSRSRSEVLRQLAQAYEGAFYLSKRDASVLTRVFEDSFRKFYGFVDGKGSKIFQSEKNDLFSVHQKFYNLQSPLSMDNLSMNNIVLVLTVNPDESFHSSYNELSDLSAYEVMQKLEALQGKEDLKSLERLKSAAEGRDMKLGVMFLEFSFRLEPILLETEKLNHSA